MAIHRIGTPGAVLTDAALGQRQAASVAELNERARDVLRHVVESYVETGEPVGSRALTRKLTASPITGQVAAVSCGLWEGTPVLDLDYPEDSKAQADANFVLTGSGGIVEVQGTAEEKPFSEPEFMALLMLAKKGIGELTRLQRLAIGPSSSKSP